MLFRSMGIEVTLVDPDAPAEEIEKEFRPNTKCVFGESIANPALVVLDFEKFARLAHDHGVPFIVDNTFATPINCLSLIHILSAKLLFGLTRNTGFEVQKGKLGPCWFESCCEWNEREEDDICGLNDNRISAKEKMLEIYHLTSLEREFKKCGLEVG